MSKPKEWGQHMMKAKHVSHRGLGGMVELHDEMSM